MNIISGNKKGRKIILSKKDFRPTQSKVREAFFNMVDIYNKTLLDLCSGSGSIGFEALSRNARHITLVEIDRYVIKDIFTNAKAIFNNNLLYKIKRISAYDYVKKTNDKFDIIYFDPPYNSKIYFNVIKYIVERRILNKNGVLAVEFGYDYYRNFIKDKNFNNIINGVMEYKIKNYGEVILIIFKLLEN